MSILGAELPEMGRPINAVIKFTDGWDFIERHILIRVNEDGVMWRDEDNDGLSNDVNVIYWEYVNS